MAAEEAGKYQIKNPKSLGHCKAQPLTGGITLEAPHISRVAAAHPAPTQICAAYIKSRGCPPCPDSNLRRLRSGTSRTRISTKRRASTSQRATSGRGRLPVGISPVRFFLRTCSDPSFRPPSRTYSWALPSGSCTWKHLPPRPETAAEWGMPTPHAPQCC